MNTTTTTQTPPAADRHAPSRTHHGPVEGDPGRSDFPTSSPGLPTTAPLSLAYAVGYAQGAIEGVLRAGDLPEAEATRLRDALAVLDTAQAQAGA